MKSFYSSIFITNIPSFYKLNLYNEINKRQSVLVFFTGDIIQERTSDFFNGDFQFDKVDLSGMSLIHKIRAIVSTLRRVKYDELIIGGWDSVPQWIAALVGSTSKNSVVIESSYIESQTRGLKGLIKKIFFKNVNRAYASGRSQRRLGESLGMKRENIIITKGVGVFNYIQQPKFSIKKQVRNFLYVGRLAPEKNLEFLINVFNSFPQYNLNIVGFGKLEPDLKKIASSNIRFLGAVDNKKLPDVYQANDVFILPSAIEPWGLVVEEALNNGLPILLSNRIGCAEEILEENVNGFSFIFNDERSLQASIARITYPVTYNRIALNISKMNFADIEARQINCYIHA